MTAVVHDDHDGVHTDILETVVVKGRLATRLFVSGYDSQSPFGSFDLIHDEAHSTQRVRPEFIRYVEEMVANKAKYAATPSPRSATIEVKKYKSLHAPYDTLDPEDKLRLSDHLELLDKEEQENIYPILLREPEQKLREQAVRSLSKYRGDHAKELFEIAIKDRILYDEIASRIIQSSILSEEEKIHLAQLLLSSGDAQAKDDILAAIASEVVAFDKPSHVLFLLELEDYELTERVLLSIQCAKRFSSDPNLAEMEKRVEAALASLPPTKEVLSVTKELEAIGTQLTPTQPKCEEPRHSASAA